MSLPRGCSSSSAREAAPLSSHPCAALSKQETNYGKYLQGFFCNHKASQNKHEKALNHKIFLSA